MITKGQKYFILQGRHFIFCLKLGSWKANPEKFKSIVLATMDKYQWFPVSTNKTEEKYSNQILGFNVIIVFLVLKPQNAATQMKTFSFVSAYYSFRTF